jgi:hypothetical protein
VVVVDIIAATICFSGSCYPVLLNQNTPRGTYQLQYYQTEQKGYDGDILQFFEDDTHVYAIHRVYTLNPKEHRVQRLKSQKVKDRFITKGCINVAPEVYDLLLDCCYNDTLEIR